MSKVPFLLETHFFLHSSVFKNKSYSLCHQLPLNVFWYPTGHLFEFLWEFLPDMLRDAHEPPLSRRAPPSSSTSSSAQVSSHHQTGAPPSPLTRSLRHRSWRCLSPDVVLWSTTTLALLKTWRHNWSDVYYKKFYKNSRNPWFQRLVQLFTDVSYV